MERSGTYGTSATDLKSAHHDNVGAFGSVSGRARPGVAGAQHGILSPAVERPAGTVEDNLDRLASLEALGRVGVDPEVVDVVLALVGLVKTGRRGPGGREAGRGIACGGVAGAGDAGAHGENFEIRQ